MTLVTFDTTTRSCVAVCRCGWRDVFTDKAPALTAAATHADMHEAAKAAAKLRERHARIIARRT